MLSSVDTTKSTGGLFFSLSMWMVICFFRSQCKNKVTNMSESKCNLQSSMEKGEGHVNSQDNHNLVFENHPKDTTENRTVDPLQELDLNNRDIENPSSVQSPQHFQCGKHKTEDELDNIMYSAFRADKSKIEGISKCLSAPMLFPCFSKSSKVSLLKSEEPMSLMTTNVHHDVTVSSFENSIYPSQVSSEPICPTTTNNNSDMTLFPNNDHAQLEATELSCDMTGVLSINTTGIFPADKCYSHEVKLNIEAGIDQKLSEKFHEDFNHETGLGRYFETQIERMGKMINEAHIVEGEIIEDTLSQYRKFEVSKAFGKKSKTWSSFYDSENNSVIFQSKTEQEPKRPIVCNESNIDQTGETHGSYFRKEIQEYSKITDDVCNIKQEKYILSDDQSQWKYNAHPSDCQDIDDEQPGPSNIIQRERVKNKQHQALLHAQTIRENLWKYHRNCCDEYQPCQTASKVLKQIKALEKTQLMQKTKQSPPLDEDLLEENPSLPLSPISLPEDHILAKPSIFSKMTCASLPNLSQYGHHQVCASHDAPSLKSSIEVSVNVDGNTAMTTTPSVGHLNLPVICVAHDEHLKNMLSYNINLPVLEDQPKNFVTSKKEMNNVSSSTLALSITDAPAEDLVGGKTRIDDKSVSHLAPPIINALTDTIRSKNVNYFSASPKELPTIGEPLLSSSVQNTCLENMMTSNLYLPVAGIHKLDIVKSLPPIKMLKERDDVKDNEPEKSNNTKIITITDPEIAGNHSFEKKGLQLNLEIKAQKSQTLSKPDANGMSINKQNNIAVISSSTSNSLIGMIANHGEVTTGENASMPSQKPLKHNEFSNVSLDTQTHLTTSVSYSNSIQDEEEVTDWPKIADLVKHSSTISLSSNFDILNHHLVPSFNPQYENVYDTSNKPNSNLIVDECEKAETMDHQLCDIDDHNNMAVEEFNCTVVQQYDMEIEDRKGLNSMENKAFYIQDETSQHYKIPSEEKAGLEILDTQGIFKDQPYTNLNFLEYAEKAQIQMENLEGMKDMNPNLDSQIINGDKVDPTSYKDSTQTSNLDKLVNSRPEVQPRSENPCNDQTDDAVYANDQTVNHKGHSLTIPVNNRPSEENKGPDISKDLTCSSDANIEVSKAEDPLPKTNMTDSRNYSDLSTAAIKDETVDFKGYEKLILGVNSNPDIVDINHVGENFEEDLNIFQDLLSSDLTAATEKICTLTGSKRRDILIAEALSDSLKNNYEDDDFNGIKYNLKESDCHFDESVNALRNPLIEGITVCNSEAAFNNGQANRINVTDASLCKTEKQMKDDQQVLGVENISKTYSKHTWSDEKSKAQLKISNKDPPANVQEFDLKDYLSCRINRRSFYSVFPFSTKTPSMEDSEVEKNSTLEGELSASDSGTTRPPLVLSKLSENKTMEASEYLAYLYASPKSKVCPDFLEGLKVASDMDDDISVLANLNFCKVALPGEITKQDISTDIQEVYINPNVKPADPESVYLPPSKEELKADDELAVLHVIYALKRSLELSHSIETETD